MIPSSRPMIASNLLCVLVAIAFTAGCNSADTAAPKQSELLTPQECAAKDGVVVGDIGDGRIHQADYTCPSGASPIGGIDFADESKIMIEGAVCCPE